MNECEGCKYCSIMDEPTRYEAEDIFDALNTCYRCRRSYRPEFMHEYMDLYTPESDTDSVRD